MITGLYSHVSCCITRCPAQASCAASRQNQLVERNRERAKHIRHNSVLRYRSRQDCTRPRHRMDGVARPSIAQTATESIDIPPHSRLLLRTVGRGDQVYGCVNGAWVLKAPDAKLLNQEGAVVGRYFAGPAWQLNDGSWVQGKAVAQQIAPDATAVPWLLLESVGGGGRLRAVRFILRTGTHGGKAPDGSCSQNAMLRVPYTATYSFYERE